MKTAEQLAQLPDDGNRYELIDGVLSMMPPAGGCHGRIAAKICMLLTRHVSDNRLGATFAAETGFLINMNPDTVRAPDAAFVCQQKMDQLDDDSGYLPFAPELAVEVISPSDSFAAVEQKSFSWLDAGTQLVLIVEPESETVHAYRSRTNMVVFQRGEPVDATDVVAGWTWDVNDLFD
jgi:Uma2 family endonuclease